jgi:hypothetical protein
MTASECGCATLVPLPVSLPVLVPLLVPVPVLELETVRRWMAPAEQLSVT